VYPMVHSSIFGSLPVTCHMKRIFYLILGVVLSTTLLKAQFQLGHSLSNYSGANAIYSNPANAVDSRFRFYMNAFDFGFHASNDYINLRGEYHPLALVPGFDRVYRIPSPYTASDYPREWIVEDLNGKPKNLFLQTEMRLLNALVNINDKNAIGIGYRFRGVMQVTNVSETLARIMYTGFNTEDELFQSGELSTSQIYTENSFNINVLATSELSFTYAREILHTDGHYLKGGITAKYFMPHYAMYIRNSDIDIQVFNNDSIILDNTDIEYGYVNESYLSDGFSPTALGGSLGADIGFVYEWRPDYKKYRYKMNNRTYDDRSKNKYKLKVAFSINDIGSVNISNDDYARAYKLRKASDILLENIEDTVNYYLNIIDRGGALTAADSVMADFIGFESSSTSFQMKLPTYLNLNVDYSLTEHFYLNLTWIQSLRNKQVNGLRGFSLLAFTPRAEWKWFEFSMPLQLTQDYSKFRMGMYLRGGPFWIGTDNLSSLISKTDIRGADVYMGLALPIHRKKHRDRDKDFVSDRMDVCKNVPGVWEFRGCPDTDGDGIQDSKDSCVYDPGLEAFHGCPDTDGDSIIDKLDSCPEVKGLAQYNGCPDMDGDSIIDKLDSCPEIAGPRQYNGCPDRDGDGVLDMNDSCPDLAGQVEHNGCPDRDGDTVFDSEDKCPDTPGLVYLEGCPDQDLDSVPDNLDLCPLEPGKPENNGCPKVEVKIDILDIPVEEQEVLKEAFDNLQFATGKSKISKESYESLDLLVELLVKKPDYKIYIAGHTDNVGGAKANKKLSQERAEAVKIYLMNKGISPTRIKTEGFGQERPVADNTTEEGRRKNRRVEFRVIK